MRELEKIRLEDLNLRRLDKRRWAERKRKESLPRCEVCGGKIENGICKSYLKTLYKKGIKMKMYRIYTENKNRSQIEQLVNNHFSGFTVYAAIGYWEEEKEKSLIIEVLGNEEDYNEIKTVCANIRDYNLQQSVLLTCQEVETEFI